MFIYWKCYRMFPGWLTGKFDRFTIEWSDRDGSPQVSRNANSCQKKTQSSQSSDRLSPLGLEPGAKPRDEKNHFLMSLTVTLDNLPCQLSQWGQWDSSLHLFNCLPWHRKESLKHSAIHFIQLWKNSHSCVLVELVRPDSSQYEPEWSASRQPGDRRPAPDPQHWAQRPTPLVAAKRASVGRIPWGLSPR